MAGVDGVAHGLSSSWSGLKRPPRSLEMRNKVHLKEVKSIRGQKGEGKEKSLPYVEKRGLGET